MTSFILSSTRFFIFFVVSSFLGGDFFGKFTECLAIWARVERSREVVGVHL